MIPAAIVTGITTAILNKLIQTPGVPVSRENSVVVKSEIEQAVKREVAPVIEHLTNNEPWYQSRVTWGAVFAVMGGIATIGTAIANGETSMDVYWTAGMSVMGGFATLWGRWAARKPLGS